MLNAGWCVVRNRIAYNIDDVILSLYRCFVALGIGANVFLAHHSIELLNFSPTIPNYIRAADLIHYTKPFVDHY